MSQDIVLESIYNASPVLKIQAALNDCPEEAGIITDECPDAYVGSRLFNVATAAMDALRREPDKPVIESPITLPEQCDWLGRFTLRILNDSISRPYFSKMLRFDSPYVNKLGTCALVEERFVEVVQSINDIEEDGEPSLLFIDKEGKPIMLKKQSGESSTLTFKPIQINGIRYPAGTLVNLEETSDIAKSDYNYLELARIDVNSINAIAPLRFSAFTFKPEDRKEAIEPITGYEISTDEIPAFTKTALSDIINRLPDKKTLLKIYSEISF